MTKISFIVPVYNCKDYLCGCVESIRSAGAEDYELLLIDDGSTDGSGELCDALAERYSRVRVIHQTNAGVSAARNRGIGEADGDYILFVDADDTLLPFDAHLLGHLACEPDMLMFGMRFLHYHREVLVKEETVAVNWEKNIDLPQLPGQFAELFRCNYLSPVWNKILKRSVLTAHKLLFDTGLTNYEDLAFSLRVLAKCRSVTVLPQAYYQYRVDYDHDRTVDRIAAIDDVIGNTDLVARTFLELERACVSAGAGDTRQLWECLLGIYFELFSVKMKRTPLPNVRRYCEDFCGNRLVAEGLVRVGQLPGGQRRMYGWIQSENVLAIWLYARYITLRHYVARNVKRITGWRL